MISPNDILQVKTFYEQGGNEALNVSFWQVDEIVPQPTTEAQLANWFHVTYYETVSSLFLHGTAFQVRTVVDNLTDGFAYGEFSSQLQGQIAGDPAPSFNAIDLKQAVGTRLTRAGRKRFPFISESMTNGNNLVMSGGDQAQIETAMGLSFQPNNPLSALEFVTLLPIVVGRTETPVGSGNYVIDIAKINAVTSAELRGITSQNTRKP